MGVSQKQQDAERFLSALVLIRLVINMMDAVCDIWNTEHVIEHAIKRRTNGHIFTDLGGSEGIVGKDRKVTRHVAEIYSSLLARISETDMCDFLFFWRCHYPHVL